MTTIHKTPRLHAGLNGTAESDFPTTALDKQVGGNHYVNLKIQPIEVTYQTFGYMGVKASIYTKVNKYLTREKGTEEENLEKAKHCLELLIEFHKKEQQE
tara:strand:- start:113 stop:412 length:300 start_codon:yes stop_codon:yes gene_type:complete